MAKTITSYSQGVEVVMPYTYVCACCGKTVTVRKSFPVIAQQSIQGYADTKRDDSIKESVSRKLPREVAATVQRETVRLESFRRSVASGAYGEYLRTGKLPQDAPSQEHSYTPPDTKRVICPACRQRQPWNLDPEADLRPVAALWIYAFFAFIVALVIGPKMGTIPAPLVVTVMTILAAGTLFVKKLALAWIRKKIAASGFTEENLPRFIPGETRVGYEPGEVLIDGIPADPSA